MDRYSLEKFDISRDVNSFLEMGSSLFIDPDLILNGSFGEEELEIIEVEELIGFDNNSENSSESFDKFCVEGVEKLSAENQEDKNEKYDEFCGLESSLGFQNSENLFSESSEVLGVVGVEGLVRKMKKKIEMILTSFLRFAKEKEEKL